MYYKALDTKIYTISCIFLITVKLQIQSLLINIQKAL